MCTVTFVPTASGFVFTSNRDEDPKRAATQLVEERRGDLLVTFPQDAAAKGTWIAFSDKDQFSCILNGAFEPHQRRENYSMSRGEWHWPILTIPLSMHLWMHLILMV